MVGEIVQLLPVGSTPLRAGERENLLYNPGNVLVKHSKHTCFKNSTETW
jgi:hypothetical protein